MLSLLTFSRQAFVAMALYLVFAGSASGLAIPDADSLVKREASPLKIDFTVHNTPQTITTNSTIKSNGISRAKVSGSDSVILTNKDLYYLGDIYLGSNRQHLQVDFDTGSSDLWVIAAGSKAASLATNGVFDKSQSSTYKSLGTKFNIEYGDHTTSQGTWSTDLIAFSASGGDVVKSLQFADVTTSQIPYGIFGIGPPGNEASIESNEPEYQNFPQLLAQQGITSKASYSLFLNAEGAATGSLIFGGIDNAKYSGSLVSLPQQDPNQLTVRLSSVTVGNSAVLVNDQVLLDSGTTLTYIASDVFNTLGDQFNGQLEQDQDGTEFWGISCDLLGTIKYNFNGVSINVPVSNLVLKNDDGSCVLGVLNADQNGNILGDNFLRSAYVYYDLTDKTISLAQVKYTTASNIVAA